MFLQLMSLIRKIFLLSFALTLGLISAQENEPELSDEGCTLLPIEILEEYTFGNFDLGIDPCYKFNDPYSLEDEEITGEAVYLHNVDTVHDYYDLFGDSINIGVIDGGNALPTHEKFGDRVKLIDDTLKIHAHTTRVAGAIGADDSGNNKKVKGVAPEATMHFFKLSDGVIADTLSTLTEYPALDISVVNNSYNTSAGWRYGPASNCSSYWQWIGRSNDSGESVYFGVYDEGTQTFDTIAKSNPSLTLVVSAGNERQELRPTDQKDYCLGKNGNWEVFNISRRYPPLNNQDNGGFDTLVSTALAKNVITVGSMDATFPINPDDPPFLDFYFNSSELGEMLKPEQIVARHSSWGPPDDGRIKPDVIAKGVILETTSIKKECREARCNLSNYGEGGNDIYEPFDGTSMATPLVTGIVALLNEQANKLERFNRDLFSYEAKAVLIHTAKSLREDNGPTYQGGWGAVQADFAAQVIEEDFGQMRHLTLEAGESCFLPASWNEDYYDSSARITAVWLDAPGSVVEVDDEYEVDDPRKALVNDLTLHVLAPKTTSSAEDRQRHYPWSLDRENPSNPPTNNGPNNVDNVERVDISFDNYDKDTWEIVLSAPDQILSSNGEPEESIGVALVTSALEIDQNPSSLNSVEGYEHCIITQMQMP